MNKIQIGIIGAAGYTGGELLRVLVNHPQAEISFVNSSSNAGNRVADVHTDLLGDTDLRFSAGISQDIDVLFLCVGHGDARKFLGGTVVNDTIKIIDLSQDFRLAAGFGLQAAGLKLQAPAFIYGLPELNRELIMAAKNIANPGCFATCIQLGLLPLAAKKLLTAEVHINATTGSTGAGQGLSSTSHFSWRNNNLSVYKAFEHQHLNEIKQSLRQLQPELPASLSFIPQRGDFTRGILAAMYTECALSLEEAYSVFEEYYFAHPFNHISRKNIDLKQVVNTNKCIIHLEKHGNKLFIVSIIDNLLKGASGQAVQNMNLLFGLEETMGLKLKGSAF
jgi:N-acetyl-gamma-glutamyl-phosphate reductase